MNHLWGLPSLKGHKTMTHPLISTHYLKNLDGLVNLSTLGICKPIHMHNVVNNVYAEAIMVFEGKPNFLATTNKQVSINAWKI